MPRVPLLEPSVQVRTPNVPSPQQTPAPPEEAFGGGVAAATAGLGKAVENAGTVIAGHVIEMAKRDSQKIVLDNLTQAQQEVSKTLADTELDPTTGVPKGYLNRQLSQANGATLESRKKLAEIAQRYAAMPVAPELQNQRDENLKALVQSANEKVIEHEATQRRAAYEESRKTFEASQIDAASVANNPIDLKPIIKAATDNVTETLQRQGHDAPTIELKKKEFAGQMIESSVKSILEDSPMKASQLLDAMKGNMLASQYLALKNTVDGKIIHDRQVSAWSAISGMTDSQGMIDLGRAEKYVYSLPNSTAEDKQQIFSFVHQMASVSDNVVKERIASNDRAFTDTLVTDWKQGTSVDEALQKATNAGRDSTDVLDKQKAVVDLYSGKTNPFDAWLEHQDAGQKLAWEEVTSMIQHKIPEKKKITIAGLPEPIGMRDAFTIEMKRAALGKSPEQILDIAKKKLENVDMGWWHFDKPQWQIDSEARVANSDAMLRIKTNYGDNLVKQATAFLQGRQQPVTPANIEFTIKAATEARKKK